MQAKLKYHAEWLLVGWAIIAVIVYFSLVPSPPVPGFAYSDKVLHVAGYAGLMSWFAQIYEQPRTRYCWAAAFMCMGAALEVLQHLGGVRSFELADMLANIGGVLLAVVLWQCLPINILRWLERYLGRNTGQDS